MRAVAGGFPRRLAETLQAPAADQDSLQLLNLLVDLVNRSDSYTAGHSARVADLAGVLARLCDFPQPQLELVRRAALFHDIGKIGVPEKMLRKRGKLSNEELLLVRMHPIFGASVLARFPDGAALVPAVLHHHENWDGSGYPAGLSMTDIPKAARIISVADSYDAMTSYRTYAPSKSSEAALQELRDGSGTRFEPQLVDAMHDAFSYGLIERRRHVTDPEAEVSKVLT